MRVALYDRPDSAPDIEEFSVSAQDYDRVLSVFRNGQFDISPKKWQVLGHVKIRSTSQPERVIRLFRTGHSQGAFSIDGAYYRGSTDKEIIAVLEDD